VRFANMSNPDRERCIKGMTNLSLGGSGGAIQLLRGLVDSCLPSTLSGGSYSMGSPSTWAQAFAELKRFEQNVLASTQVSDWMSDKRSKWIKFCDNVDNQHPAGFATATLALEISIKADAQHGSWMSSQRSGWVSQCNDSGAKPFDWDDDNFVCSGLDGAESLLQDLVQSMRSEYMNGSFTTGDYKNYAQLFAALKQFECQVSASGQQDSWMSGQRSKWISFCNDSSNHTPSGFVTAVYALDVSIKASSQTDAWMGGQRSVWVTRCQNAGAAEFDWS